MKKEINTINLESADLKISLLPSLGFKISSIYHKKSKHEFVFQAQEEYKENIPYGSSFEKYDTSGIDDCLPTIDKCFYPDTSIELPDHGEIWSRKFDEISIDSQNRVSGRIKLKSLPLIFEKSINLNENTLSIDYRVINNTDKDYYYLWAFHGLLNFNEATELDFPKNLSNYINVQNDEVWNFDIKKLKNFKKDSTFKYYFTDEITEAWAKLKQIDKNLELKINFDPTTTPYMGVWITTGGFKGQNNLAIEPCNGFYDSLKSAVNNKKARKIKANSQDKFNIKLEIKEINNG
ncbi:hypothetical protein ACQRBF_03780 [Peptoniphilaceae bacterium SGI.131]